MELKIYSDEDILVSSERRNPTNGEKEPFIVVIHGNGHVYVTMWKDGKEEVRLITIEDVFKNGTVVGPPFGTE